MSELIPLEVYCRGEGWGYAFPLKYFSSQIVFGLFVDFDLFKFGHIGFLCEKRGITLQGDPRRKDENIWIRLLMLYIKFQDPSSDHS